MKRSHKNLTSIVGLSECLSNLQRSLAFLEDVFLPESSEGQRNERHNHRFWGNVVLSNKDPRKNRELLDGYIETTTRLEEQQHVENNSQRGVSGRKEDAEINNMLFYELALDGRTKPICVLYGVGTFSEQNRYTAWLKRQMVILDPCMIQYLQK